MKQHYLPQCYLREFCNRDGKLHTLDIALLAHRRKVFDQPRFPAEVCRSADFYTIQPGLNKSYKHLLNIDPLFLEKAFHNYERRYPELVQKIKNGQQALIREDAALLLYALIDIKIRNPYFRNKGVAANKDEFLTEMGKAYKNEVANLDLSEFPNLSIESLIDLWEVVSTPFENDENFAKNAHISSMVLRTQEAVSVQEQIVNHLLQFQWLVFESKGLFITNDNPGVSLDQNKKVQNTLFNGQFHFFMPLTPSLCLGISPVIQDLKYGRNDAQKTLKYVTAPKELVDLINEFHGYHHTQYIFAGSKKVIDEIALKINKVANLNG